MRITPQELAALERGEAVRETLYFGGVELWRALLEPAPETHLKAEGAKVVFALSAFDLNRLLDPGAEGVYFSTDVFHYFVEKDFPCAHPRAAEALEPASETFAPPPGFEARKN